MKTKIFFSKRNLWPQLHRVCSRSRTQVRTPTIETETGRTRRRGWRNACCTWTERQVQELFSSVTWCEVLSPLYWHTPAGVRSDTVCRDSLKWLWWWRCIMWRWLSSPWEGLHDDGDNLMEGLPVKFGKLKQFGQCGTGVRIFFFFFQDWAKQTRAEWYGDNVYWSFLCWFFFFVLLGKSWRYQNYSLLWEHDQLLPNVWTFHTEHVSQPVSL